MNDNTAGTNSIAGFDRHANGSPDADPGGPFAAGGAGTGTAVASEGSIQRAGRYLLAVDPGSNQLSVLRIHGGGKLSAVGSPVWSHGIQPVSITVHNRLVYVANAGDGGVNYTGFRLSASGRLSHLRGSTVALPDGSQPGQVLFNATGTKVAGTRVGTSLIDSFAVRPNGRLRPRQARRTPPRASARSAASSGLPSRGSCSCRTPMAVPAMAPSPPIGWQATAPCRRSADRPSPTTRRRRAGSRSATTAASCSPSTPRRRASPAIASVPAGRCICWAAPPFNSSTGLAPLDARLSPGGSSLWVVDNSGAISGFRVHGGHLHEFAGSPTAVPAGAVPFGIVVT